MSNQNLKMDLLHCLDILSPTERDIFRLRCGLGETKPRTLDEVCEFLGLTRQYVRQIEVEIFRKLKINNRPPQPPRQPATAASVPQEPTFSDYSHKKTIKKLT